MLHLQTTEVVLVHCNIVSNNYEHDSRALYTFISNKLYVQLLDIPPKNLFFFFKICNSEFSYIEMWFTDQSSKPLGTILNITLVIKV